MKFMKQLPLTESCQPFSFWLTDSHIVNYFCPMGIQPFRLYVSILVLNDIDYLIAIDCFDICHNLMCVFHAGFCLWLFY